MLFVVVAARAEPVGACVPTPYPDAVLLGAEAGGHFGDALASGLDVSGDALDDLVVGAPDSGQRAGAVTLICGGALCEEARGVWFEGYLGGTLALVPDSDGDGLAEVLAGAWGALDAGDQRGAAWLLPGAPGGLGAPLALDPEIYGSGRRVGAGDFDGDDVPDLLIGGFASAVTVAGLGGLGFGAPVEVVGPLAYDETGGDGLAVIGDAYGDGRDDLAVHDATGAADVAAWWLPAGGTEPAAPILEPGVDRYAYRWTAPAGDIDEDGLADLVVGGEVSLALFRGTPTGPEHVATYAYVGARVAALDWDGDGDGELAIVSGTAVSVHDLDGGGLVEPPRATFTVECGAGPLAGGDLDGDGADELAVGTSYVDLPDAPEVGAVWVLSSTPPAAPPDLGDAGALPDEPIPGDGIDRPLAGDEAPSSAGSGGCAQAPGSSALALAALVAAVSSRRSRSSRPARRTPLPGRSPPPRCTRR